MKKSIYFIALSLFSIVGCAQQGSNNQDTSAASNVSNTGDPTIIKRVSKAEFKSYLESHDNAQLVDVRTPGEFTGGAIDGAVNIDYNSATFEQDIQTLDKNEPVLIYCRSGGRSAKALKVFESNGFTNVLELEGGFMNW